jgi:hypothetical protein
MRLQLDLDDADKQQLLQLEEMTGLTTHTDFFDAAVTLLDWAVKQRRSGRIIASLDENNMNYKELQMPPLEYAARFRDTLAEKSVAVRR